MHGLILAALFLPLGFGSPTARSGGQAIEADPGSITLQGGARFTARILASEGLRDCRLILAAGTSRYALPPAVTEIPDGYSLVVEDASLTGALFPFSFVKYWWEAELEDGISLSSDTQSVQFLDDRFAWFRRADRRVGVAWVEGDEQAAEDAADLALLALGTIAADLEAPIPERIELYIYPRLADLTSAMAGRLHGWEGGVSDPGSGVILLAAAPGAEGRQALAVLVPHEVAHLLIGARWAEAESLLPCWLVEGTAASYEMAARPEADRALRAAVEQGGLIPIRTLCGAFPSEESAALLAYAESKSFVVFLRDTYGWPALRRVFSAYAAGAECGEGTEAAGAALEQLESEWIRRLTDTPAKLPDTWILVLAGAAALAVLLAVQSLIRREKGTTRKGREEAG
ncbi:MAG: hypothetical protein JW929_01980 [Anaerolineales bacterium]|nr:hypothetical protein [Anaerolineales bacterium]